MASNIHNHIMHVLQFRRSRSSFNADFALKISLGLVLLTIVPFTLAYAETISVDVGDSSFDVEYTVFGMTVTDVESDVDFDAGYLSIILGVDVFDSEGMLAITFDRSFFDASELGPSFFVLSDGDELSYQEDVTLKSRSLTISLPLGTEEVEIIGSTPLIDDPALIPPPEPVDREEDLDVFSEPPPKDEREEELPVSGSQEEPEPIVKDTESEEPEVMDEKDDGDDKLTDPALNPCGPGTVLKDGICVLDEACGPGTILQDDTCIIDPTPQQPAAPKTGLAKELIFGAVAGFVVAGIVGVFLAIISRASKNKTKN